MRAGDRIHHPEHGAGSVLVLRCGRKVRVRLDAAPGLPRTFHRGDLTVLDGEGSSKPAAAVVNGRGNGRSTGLGTGHRARQTRARITGRTPTKQCAENPPRRSAKNAVIPAGAAASPDERVELRQTMEALRLGVVPARYVRDYTVGRAAELASFDALLDAGRGLRTLWGDYGHGKTHQLEVLERVALERDFVTARITLDPREVPPTHPKRLGSIGRLSRRFRSQTTGARVSIL